MSKKYSVLCLLVLVMLTSLFIPAFAQDEVFQVAMVMPSKINDYSFSQSMFEALKVLQNEAGEENFEIVYSEDMFNVADAREAIRDYADMGFDLVVAHGSQYGTSIQEIAPDYPETAFAWGNGTDFYGLDNVSVYQARAEQGGYVFGQIAAAISENGKLGVCGPVESGDAKTYIDGFKNGATEAGAEVSVTYTSSFSDVSLMSAAAETHMDEGATILTGTSQSIPGAVSVVKERNGLWMGVQWDTIPLAPENVLVSLVYDWTPILSEIISNMAEGVYGGAAYDLTFENGGLKILWNNENLDIDQELIDMADELAQKIVAGEIVPIPAE
ncbi:MAG: BMP family protein [Flexilinea sp.]|jgi:basic membrane protein A